MSDDQAAPSEVPQVPTEVPLAPTPLQPDTTPEAPVAPTPETPPMPDVPEAPPTPMQPAPPTPSPSPQAATHGMSRKSLLGVAKRKQKIEEHLQKILTITRERGKITNRDVVKTLRISDSTVSRYLKMLVTRGQLQKTGRGRAVVYTI